MTDLDDFWPPSAAIAPRRGESDRTRHRRRSKTLSRDEIVQGALALADAEGAGAVNMRRIAQELGVSPMSLYWHVTDKDQLLDLMLDAVEKEGGITDLSGDWKADFRRIGRQRRRVLLDHPWVLDFVSGRTPFGPNALLQIERSLSVFDGFDLANRTALQILMTIDAYVSGSVLNEIRESRVEETQARAGLDDTDFAAAMSAWRDRLNNSGQFARILRVFEEGIDPDAAETCDERFEFGLDCVLDGVAARLLGIRERSVSR